MAVNTKLGVSRPHVAGIVIGGETLTLSTTSGTLAGQHSATVPSGTTRILCVPAATVYFANNKTASSTVGDAVADGEGRIIEHDQIGSCEVVAASGTPTMVVIYLGYPT